MRRALAFLIAVLALYGVMGGTRLSAEEVMVGRVLSLDREAGELVVAPGAGYESEQHAEEPQEIRVQYPGDRMPSQLQVGDVVRIWGDFSSKGRLQFNARHLGYGSGGRDPTGVRSRINRGFGVKRGRSGEGRGQGRRGGP